MDDDTEESWSYGASGISTGTGVQCYDWSNSNRTMTFVQCCSECGAATWTSCICLRSADPEDEDDDGQKVASGPEEAFKANYDHTGVMGPEQSGTVMESTKVEPGILKGLSSDWGHETIEPMDELKVMLEHLSKLHATLDIIRKDKETKKQSLGESCITFLHELKSFRKKTIDHLNNLEKKAKSELNNLYEKLDEVLQSDIQTCERTREELSKISETLTASDFNFKMFMDTVESKLEEAREVIKDLSKSDNTCKFQYIFHPTLQSVSSKFQSLGRFVFEQNGQPPAEMLDLIDGSDVSVRHSSDTKSCCIAGICQLDDGKLMLTDRNNNSLKCVDDDFKLINSCELPASPRDVCCTGGQKVAVALNNNSVQFVDVGSELKQTHMLSVSHECWGLAYLNGKLYVSDWGSNVYIYNLSGSLVKIVSKDQHGRKIFTNCRHMAVNAAANQVYVCDRVKGLVTMDETGRVLSEASHPDLKVPHGVSVDQKGNVFLSGALSQNIILHSEKLENTENNSFKNAQKSNARGDKTRVLVKAGGVRYPGALWFVNNQSKLLVASYPPFGGCDTMRVFSIV